MEKVVVWEKKVVLYMADSARRTKNESSEYLNHITSKNTHKTPKLWKLCYGTKLVTGKKRTEGISIPALRSGQCVQNPAEAASQPSLQLCPGHGRAPQSPGSSSPSGAPALWQWQRFLRQMSCPMERTA